MPPGSPQHSTSEMKKHAWVSSFVSVGSVVFRWGCREWRLLEPPSHLEKKDVINKKWCLLLNWIIVPKLSKWRKYVSNTLKPPNPIWWFLMLICFCISRPLDSLDISMMQDWLNQAVESNDFRSDKDIIFWWRFGQICAPKWPVKRETWFRSANEVQIFDSADYWGS